MVGPDGFSKGDSSIFHLVALHSPYCSSSGPQFGNLILQRSNPGQGLLMPLSILLQCSQAPMEEDLHNIRWVLHPDWLNKRFIKGGYKVNRHPLLRSVSLTPKWICLLRGIHMVQLNTWARKKRKAWMKEGQKEAGLAHEDSEKHKCLRLSETGSLGPSLFSQ